MRGKFCNRISSIEKLFKDITFHQSFFCMGLQVDAKHFIGVFKQFFLGKKYFIGVRIHRLMRVTTLIAHCQSQSHSYFALQISPL